MERQGNQSGIERMCTLAGVSRAGYYRHWLASKPREEATALRDAIQRLSLAQRKNGYRYNGYRQITVLLHREGWAVNHKRVARIRREDNLLCVPKLSFRPPPTDSRHGWRMWPNLARHPVPMAVNQLWVADITLGSSPRACLYKAARRVRLSGCCAGCIQPARGWLGDGGAFASRARAGCVGHGDCQSQRDARRAGPSLGSRRAICLRRIHCPS
jgi:hypothetical protein